MRAIGWAAVLYVFALVGSGQTPQSAGAPKKEPPPGVIQSITIVGNSRYTAEEVVKATGLKVGEHISARDIERGRITLQSTELFNSVSDAFRFKGTPPNYELTFTVAENEQTFPMRFERLGLQPDAIRQCVKSHVDFYNEQIPATEGVLSRYTRAVQGCVAEHDPSLKVKATVSNDDPKQLAVLFAPDAPALTISQVLVSGNEAVDTGTILRAVNPVAIGVPLTDVRLKMILDSAIKPLYATKGYAAVTFPKIDTEPSKTNLGVVVKVAIKDGPVFKFGAIRFRGNGMDQDEIRANIPFKPGQTYNGKQVDDFRLWLNHSLRRRGLLDASVLAEMQPNDANRAVDVAYNVIPGSLYNFQKLDIQGLDATSAPAIERLWGEKQGKPFNPDYPDFFLKRVEEQGLFDNLANTTSDYTADASTHNVTVHLYFKGGKSKKDVAKQKQEEEERRKSDGTWSPYPLLHSTSGTLP
jgi:outer membrane protein insertion porin family